MQDKYTAKVWDEDKQEWAEQEILVAHLVDEKESKKRKKQKAKHFLGNALSFIVECLCAFLMIIVIGFIMDIIGVPSAISKLIEYVVGIIIGYWLAGKLM